MSTLAPHQIEGVTFQPWIGSQYSDGYPRLLIVGQSHYDWEGREIPLKDVTTCVIRESAIELGRGPFFTNIVATCTGSLPDAERRSHFWESVAFYNYIQRFVGMGPRQPHPYELWAMSHRGFLAVLEELQPQLILFLGKTNFLNAAPTDIEGEPLNVGPIGYRQTFYYPLGNSEKALAIHVKHPASGYNFRDFAALVAEGRSRASGRIGESR